MSDDELDDADLRAKLGVFAHTAPLREQPPRESAIRPPRRRWVFAAVGATLAAAAVIAYLVRQKPQPCAGDGLAFEIAGGTATCRGHAVARGALAPGAWLETDTQATATVALANVGTVTIGAGSRVRVVESKTDKQRIELARGSLTAEVNAPPRLFVVDTPVTTAVDLGCAYAITVAQDGGTHLRVTRGAVNLEDKRGTIYVPATFEIDMLPGRLGTPVSVDATPDMRALITRLDRGEDTLGDIVAMASFHERVTLWNLINRTHDRRAIDKLVELAPLPDASLRAKVDAGNADAMDIWLDVFVDRGNLAHKPR
ncbi:MAG: FecR family protein [Kofleriaceae bacterium]